VPAEHELAVDGLPTYVRTYGSGLDNVVVVINGGPGQSHHYTELADVLATTEVMVVNFDQRGTGRTAHPPDDDYHLTAYAKDLESIRYQLGVETIHLIGHSWGGLFAMAYAAKFPDRVSSLQLYSSSPVRQPETDLDEFYARIHHFEEDGTFPLGYDEIEGSNDCAPYFQTIWPVYLYDIDFVMPDLLVETTCDLETFFGTESSNLFGWDYATEMGKLEVPVGVYYGEADPFKNESLAIPRHFDRADLVEIEFEACGHYWEECSDAFFDQAASFLADAM
jgi:pimeloyl-ACP methyl ester carboxylesterase